MTQRGFQRIIGFLSILGGGSFVYWNWAIRLEGRHFYWNAAMVAPFFVVLGLGMLFLDFEERIVVDKVTRLEYTTDPKATRRRLVILAMIVGVANYFVMKFA